MYILLLLLLSSFIQVERNLKLHLHYFYSNCYNNNKVSTCNDIINSDNDEVHYYYYY